MKLLFLGPPGAGKGTQAALVAGKHGIPAISTGEILREAMKVGAPVGLKAKSYVDQGLLVPDEVMIEIVRDRIGQPDCANGFILDGFPRTVPQARALEEICQLDRIIYMTMPDEAIVKRLSGRRVCENCGATHHVDRLKGRSRCEGCGGNLVLRKDDAPETVLGRLSVYHEQTAPLVEYYQGTGRLTQMDGAMPLDEGFAYITGMLERLQRVGA
ncbi:MAG: adenylate kinase [Oscillospiraceae bacterium]|jgi:adenylate kinase|nr:adenylate kinase [Oscillospiraceae bacterium]